MKHFFLYLLLLLFIHNYTFAQNNPVPILEREVTIHSENQSVESILDQISTQSDCVFSYSPDAINREKKVTLHINQKPVRLVLNQLFEDETEYKVKNKYLILHKTPAYKRNQELRKLEGYVYDSRTGKRLTETSVYDKTLMASAVTDQYGYFSMKLPPNKPITSICVSKIGYSDTTIITNNLNKKINTIEIASNPQDTLHQLKKIANILLPKLAPIWMIPKKIRINSLNISDSFLSTFQLSLVPKLSTNQLLGGNATNKFSFNTTVGYVQGVKYAELGGIMNIVLGSVSYCQIAGIGNLVGKNVTGVQAAGIFNSADSVKGIQCCGIINMANKNSDIQVAGIINKTAENKVQVAGIVNKASSTTAQLAGILNIAGESNTQIAGIFNNAVFSKEMQVSGITNLATVSKFQISSCFNNSLEETEFQISGLINKAGYVKNMQIGFINIADSCKGVPIGFLNFIKYGYHKLEFSTDEMLTANIAYRTGVKQFHTFLTAGITTGYGKSPFWSYGYGLGTSFGKTEKLLVDLDISTNQIHYQDNFNFDANLQKLYVGLDFKLVNKISLAAGITYNLLITNTQNSNYKSEYKIAPYSLTNSTVGDGLNIKTWIGGKIALRFF